MGRPPTLYVQAGQRIGRGTVIDPEIRVQSGKTNRRGARLRCDCGNIYEAEIIALVPYHGAANKTSCGCARRDHIRTVRGPGRPAPKTHGMSQHPLYPTWMLMLQRCENPQFHKYPRYGGRGIAVCDRWHDVSQFIVDIEREIGPRPAGCTLDRTENDGNYEPGNVRWATPRQQARNQSRQGSSQRHGVQYVRSRRKWVSRIHVGVFDTEEEAAATYQRAVDVLEREGILR
jgi:hypothetical protein